MQPARGGRVSRRAWLQGAVAAGVGVITGAAGWGYLYERERIDVTHVTLPVSGLPESLDGITVGLITDLHLSDTVPRRLVDRAVSLLQAEQPDIIALGGDYVSWFDRRYAHTCAEALAPLSAPHGVYAILGNHDDDREMPTALSAQGFEVLLDARTQIRIKNEPIEIAGLRFWTRKTIEIATVLRGATAPTVLLAHDPRRLDVASELDVAVVLAGHTHGGQILLPGLGAIATRGRNFPVEAGMTRRENTTLYVSRGVGTVYVPIRINCPPEVAVLRLQRLSDI